MQYIYLSIDNIPTVNNFLTIDPGYNTAIIRWKKISGMSVKFNYWLHKPIKFEINSMPKILTLWSMFDCYLKCNTDDESPVIEYVYIEGTSLYQENLTSLASASKGYLFELTGLTYGYIRICQQYGISCKIIKPNEWKGQMSKDAVKGKIKRKFPHLDFKNEHIMDAFAMGVSIVENWRETK